MSSRSLGGVDDPLNRSDLEGRLWSLSRVRESPEEMIFENDWNGDGDVMDGDGGGEM